MTLGDDYENLAKDDLLALLRRRDAEDAKGTRLRYAGQRLPWQLVREVKPRRQRLDQKLAHPEGVEHSDNLILEGENLQGMVSLYKYKGQVDLVLTDPPYNTGRDFRYNDKWDTDPNDADLGKVVSEEDGSRHAKWLRFMHPRVWMMKEMLRPGGVLAICIDHRELYRLGLLLDQVFGEQNRLGVINWQKTTPKSTTGHLSVVTEYVLVYAKGKDRAKTADIERSLKADARFGNIDNDRSGEWKQGDLTAPDASDKSNYAIQSPFTGEFHTPGNRHWSHKRSQMKLWLSEWGSEYEDFDLKDNRGKALALKGWKSAKTPVSRAAVITAAKKRAEVRMASGSWPLLYWGVDGLQKPVRKNYKEQVRMGAVPTNLWVEEDELPPPEDLQAITWLAAQSGRTRDGGDTLTEIMGKNHGFETVKPMRLIKKIIQIWCPPNGTVLDPFAGSGTTGHAVLVSDSELSRNGRGAEVGR